MRAVVGRDRKDTHQLDLFSFRPATYETLDAIRSDGRETLAGVSPPDGRGIGSEGSAPPDVAHGGRSDRNGTGLAAATLHPPRLDANASSSASVGNGAETLHLPPARILAVARPGEGAPPL